MTSSLKERIQKRTGLRVGIIGVGYIGLPLAVRLAGNGISVTGIDTKPSVISNLKDKKSTVEGIEAERLEQVQEFLNFVLVNETDPGNTSKEILEMFTGIDVFVICVPTPLDKTKEWEPDLGFIESAYRMLRRICDMEKETGQLPQERLVVLESTTSPGTTRNIFYPLLEDFESTKGKWYLVYSPERTNPGPDAHKDKTEEELNKGAIPGAFQVPKIVGGIDDDSRDIGEAFYRIPFDDVRTVSSLETAELVKLVENTFRFTSIAFANEMARVAKTLDVDIWEVIDAARSKPFGFELCFPGLIGGHCLPIDPHYLNSAIRNRQLASTFVDVAESEHQNMRREAFDLIQRLLNQQNRGISGSSILFLGVSYKKEIADIRESAAIKLMQKLFSYGATVNYWDPIRAKHPEKPPVELKFTPKQYDLLPERKQNEIGPEPKAERYVFELTKGLGADWNTVKKEVLAPEISCVVIATDHPDFKSAYLDLVSAEMPIADLCNAIGNWLNHADLDPQQTETLRQKLKDRKKFMLLGVH